MGVNASTWIVSVLALSTASAWERQLQENLSSGNLTLQAGYDEQLKTNILYGLGYGGLAISGFMTTQMVVEYTGSSFQLRGTW